MEKMVQASSVDQTEPNPLLADSKVRHGDDHQHHEEPPSNPKNSGSNMLKPVVMPDRLKVPKAFKYPERYSSPTDLMMSPISRGLLARSKKASAVPLLPPFKKPTKCLLST